jgi:hypothetical protein
MNLAVQQKMKTAVRLDGKQMESFQYWIRKGFGKLKGAQEIALNDAVKLWTVLADGGQDIWFGYVETTNGLGGYRALTIEDVMAIIPELRMANVKVVQGCMRPPILKALMKLKPDKVLMISRSGKEEINAEEGFDELFREIATNGDAELCLMWSRERRVVFFNRERFSLGGEVEYSLAVRNLLQIGP